MAPGCSPSPLYQRHRSAPRSELDRPAHLDAVGKLLQQTVSDTRSTYFLKLTEAKTVLENRYATAHLPSFARPCPRLGGGSFAVPTPRFYRVARDSTERAGSETMRSFSDVKPRRQCSG